MYEIWKEIPKNGLERILTDKFKLIEPEWLFGFNGNFNLFLRKLNFIEKIFKESKNFKNFRNCNFFFQKILLYLVF